MCLLLHKDGLLQGWTKTNAFHVCITSYKLVVQDHQAFRRKKWKYLILDEVRNTSCIYQSKP